MTTETDADGWTTVRRRRRADDEDMINAIQLREKRRREAMQKKDFYKALLVLFMSVGSKDAKTSEIS